MIPRRWLMAIALASGALAAGTFLLATERADVVVATRDIDVPRALTADDVEVRSLSADLVPDDAARRVDDVVGLAPRAPLVRGQLIFMRAVSDDVADFRSGVALPPGMRAVAIPIAATSAVGGAVLPGSRVDVLAVPVLGRAPAGRQAELLIASALVLDVRGESGLPFLVTVTKQPASVDRIASVVVGIDPLDEVRIADRIATSTFVLALVSAR